MLLWFGESACADREVERSVRGGSCDEKRNLAGKVKKLDCVLTPECNIEYLHIVPTHAREYVDYEL